MKMWIFVLLMVATIIQPKIHAEDVRKCGCSKDFLERAVEASDAIERIDTLSATITYERENDEAESLIQKAKRKASSECDKKTAALLELARFELKTCRILAADATADKYGECLANSDDALNKAKANLGTK